VNQVRNKLRAVSSEVGVLSVATLRRRWRETSTPGSWREWASAAAVRRAIRAAVVMPVLFAITLEGFGNLQLALFASFGAFATLVLVTFGGTTRDKLTAHLVLAVTCTGLLVIGTAVNSSALAGGLVTIPVAFLIFFAGVTGPNAASGVTGALLAYVLPAASPGTMSMVPDRIAGWWLASIVGTAAVVALPNPQTADRLRAAVTALSDSLADELEAMLAGEESEQLLQRCLNAKNAVLSVFTATAFRPTGLAIRDQALANSTDLLEWLTQLVGDTARAGADVKSAATAERELLRIAASTLRAAGRLFSGGRAVPDLERLDAQRIATLEWVRQVPLDSPGYEDAARLSFHTHTIAITILGIGANALTAAKLVDPEWIDETAARWYAGAAQQPLGRGGAITAYARVVRHHATTRSVWFVSSVRGACALAAAVAIADASTVQHGFWVVLGTLSVLRTSAAATGATALRGLLGTALGFVVGAVLLLIIGTSSTALWVTLPIAVFVAAYAPGTLPFAFGQAAFTVTVVVLFNLLNPIGWKIGELRILDVAIGCGVSLAVGVLFWPRGNAPVVGNDLADAFRAGAMYLREAIDWVSGPRTDTPQAGGVAFVTARRLDDALRGFLAEQGTKHIEKEELWRLVGGTLRLRLTAHTIAGLPHGWAARHGQPVQTVVRQADELCTWYDELAASVDAPRPGAQPRLSVPSLACEAPMPGRYRRTIWLEQYLSQLVDHLEVLIDPAAHVAAIRARPWWR
jgi:uncharacterized membrane protein YgaE (UPF0421/DUF939 family)